MKDKVKNNLSAGVTGLLLGSALVFQGGCQYMPWAKKKQASVEDTMAPVVGDPAVFVPQKMDSAYNAEYDALASNALSEGVFQEPVRPALPPVIMEESPLPDPFIPDLNEPGFQELAADYPKNDSNMTYIVQKGDTLWAISQQFKVSLNKLLSSNNLTRTSLISVGQSLTIPGVSESTPPVSPYAPAIQSIPQDIYANSGNYVVQGGDHLTKIAYKYGTSVAKLKEANGLVTDRLQVGQRLIVPGGGQIHETWSPTTAGSPSASTASTMSSGSASGSSRANGDYHVVRSGEYPGSIARMYGLKTNELMAMNNISDPRKIQIGTKLLVKKSGSVPSSVSTIGAPSAPQAPSATTAVRGSSGKLDLGPASLVPAAEEELQLQEVTPGVPSLPASLEDIPVMTVEPTK
jgi:LysM repeat protein